MRRPQNCAGHRTVRRLPNCASLSLPVASGFSRKIWRTMKARVFVTLKPSVFDPQGKTIADALHSLGYKGVGDVRQGKYFELELDAASALAWAASSVARSSSKYLPCLTSSTPP